MSENVKIGLDEIASKYNEAVVIDLSWLMYRSFFAFKELSVVLPENAPDEPTPTGHLYGVLDTVNTFLRFNPNSAIILVRDGKPQERIDEAKAQGVEYKAGRPELEYNFFNDLSALMMMVSCSPRVYYAYNSDKEADDTAKAIVEGLKKVSPQFHINVVTSDNDWLQMVTLDGTVVFSTNWNFDENRPDYVGNLELTTQEKWIKKYKGVTTDKLVFFRSVIGDKSDNINGIPRFNRKALKEICMIAESIDDLFDYRIRGLEKYYDLLNLNRDLVKRNYSLMLLKGDFEPNVYKITPDKSVMDLIFRYQMNKWLGYLKSLEEFNG